MFIVAKNVGEIRINILIVINNDYRIDDNPFLSDNLFNNEDSLSVLLWIKKYDDNKFDRISYKRFQLKKYCAISFGNNLLEKNISPVYRINDCLLEAIKSEIKRRDIDKIIIKNPRYESEFKIIDNLRLNYPNLIIITKPSANLIDQESFINKYGFPKSFTKFRKIVEKNNYVLNPINTRRNLNIFEKSEYAESKIKQIYDIEKFSLKSFIVYMKKFLPTYKNTRDQLHGNNISSQLSIPLSLGLVSPRRIFHFINVFEKKVISNQSTYWLKFELLWREYFKLLSLSYGSKIFSRNGILDTSNIPDNDEVDSIKNIKLEDDLIKSINNQLIQSGFISNRARQIFASYLIYNLNIDWLSGAYYFKNNLIDYDTENNFSNWMYIAGVGTDPRGGRLFNLDKQKSLYDSNSEYRKKWL